MLQIKKHIVLICLNANDVLLLDGVLILSAGRRSIFFFEREWEWSYEHERDGNFGIEALETRIEL